MDTVWDLFKGSKEILFGLVFQLRVLELNFNKAFKCFKSYENFFIK